MKALVFSDVHSNIYALEAIWHQEKDSDLIFCAGDLVDYGPFPKETLSWIRAHNVTSVQGNHDRYVALCYRTGQTYGNVLSEERAWAHYNAGLLDLDEIEFLEQLPLTLTFELDGSTYGLSHLYEGYKEIVSLHAFEQFRFLAFVDDQPERVTRLVFGHTHRQSVRYLSDELLWMNPGSASYRRQDDPDQTAHYLTITDGQISLRRLVYDISPLRQAASQINLMESETRAADWYFGLR